MIEPGSADWNLLEEMVKRLSGAVVQDALDRIVQNQRRDDD